jgi:glycosyltransferase involved in cell wall biosynthesis
MRLYAERLGEALMKRGAVVRRVHPPRLVPEPWPSRSWLWRKIDDYGGSHVVYPRILHRVRTDLTHVIDHSQGYLISSLNPRRTIVTCHDVILLALATGRIGGTNVPRVALQIFRLSLELAKRAAAIIADSSQTKRDLTNLVGVDPAKIRVIFPGLNQSFTVNRERGEEFRRRLGLGAGRLMLHIGRTFYKNIPGVLKVLHRLRKDGVDVRLVRTGRPLFGDDRAAVEKLRLGGAVVELGAVQDRDIPALYNAVDLLLFPSLYEGFGWPPLEAMASGIPVVASRAGSLDEIVGDAALTADAEDVETLAWHAATVLTDDGVREKLIRRGLDRAAQFNWDRTAAETIEVYRDVAARAD